MHKTYRNICNLGKSDNSQFCFIGFAMCNKDDCEAAVKFVYCDKSFDCWSCGEVSLPLKLDMLSSPSQKCLVTQVLNIGL